MGVYTPTYRGGDLSFLYMADESQPYLWNSSLNGSLPAFSGSPLLVGYVNIPGYRASDGGKNGFAAGSPFAQYTLNGMRVYEVTVQLRIAQDVSADSTSLEFLMRCLRTSNYDNSVNGAPVSTYYGLPQVTLYIGSDNQWRSAGAQGGYTRVLRWATCNRVTLNFGQGGGQEIIAECQFMGLMEQAGSALTPNLSFLQELASPVAFQNLLNVYLGQTGEDFRAIADSATVTVDNNLEAKSIQPDDGTNIVYSRIPYALLPHNEVATFNARFHDTNFMIGTTYTGNNFATGAGLDPLRTGTAGSIPNANDWSNGSTNSPSIELVVDNSPAGSTYSNPTAFALQMQLALMNEFNQASGDSGTEQMGTITAEVSQVQIVQPS